MPEQTGIQQDGFFQRIIESANSGRVQDAEAAGSGGVFSHMGDPLQGLGDPFLAVDPMADGRTELTTWGFDDPRPSGDVSARFQESWCGEEGPLSGVAPGLNETVDHFGVSANSRSDPKAVGSASESSRDTHVEGIEHTEVGHASGHLMSSSTGRIESGVSKPPESHQVLFKGSKVVRYADAKGWRQQAVPSHGHGDRGLGQSGQDDDRAGLPPPSLFQHDPADAGPEKDVTPMAPENNGADRRTMDFMAPADHQDADAAGNDPFPPGPDESPIEDATRFSDPTADFKKNQMDTPADQKEAVISKVRHPDQDIRDPGASTDKKHASKQSAPSDLVFVRQLQHTRIAQRYEQGAGSEKTSPPLPAAPVKRSEVGLKKTLTEPARDHGLPPGSSVDNTGETGLRPPTAHQKEYVPGNRDRLISNPDMPAPEFHSPLLTGPLQNPFRGQTQKAPVQDHGATVEIGQIDVIIETPRTPPQNREAGSGVTSNMTSRYYLKGL